MNSWRRTAARIAVSALIHDLQSVNNTILVTGGVGFIGSNVVLDWISWETDPVVNLDKLTYAGDPSWSTSSRTASRE
jgi:FlaA1/EpsC-like NDP-sugar epimerase